MAAWGLERNTKKRKHRHGRRVNYAPVGAAAVSDRTSVAMFLRSRYEDFRSKQQIQMM